MPLTVTIIDTKSQASGVGTTITSNTLTGAAEGDWIDIIEVSGDNANETAWTVTNTGTAITWTLQQETNTANQTKVIHWTGTAGATPPGTVSVQATAGGGTNGAKALIVIVQAGQHATTPLPAGNLFLKAAGNDLSQAIMPTSAGSNLWMVGADWNQSNSFTAGTDNTLPFTPLDIAGQMTTALTRPTTQPRTDTVAFTLSLLDSSSPVDKVLGIAWEVQAAAGGGGGPIETLMGQACL